MKVASKAEKNFAFAPARSVKHTLLAVRGNVLANMSSRQAKTNLMEPAHDVTHYTVFRIEVKYR